MSDLDNQALTAFALNCSLRPSGSDQPSSTDKMIDDLLTAMRPHGITGEVERVVDHDVKPGVQSDMGPGDDWPKLRARVMAADIFILGTPIWLGHPSSVARRVLERMDAFLSETDERGRMPAAGKVALVAVVGNEDGAHACHAACFQGLNDVGFTIPANAGVYWVGEAMNATNYVDLETIPDPVQSTLDTAASNAAHLARLLKRGEYPGTSG
ncbi:Multimeric flavodoxin WrbA [Palleronia marisminoris]|uniref:flavodoxin family protein n=1 Tax=Palleronia marisminoris TaxID=315423 RepID=UPI0008EA4705|nr:NAD(P)H-dependent oxidoreductase [Palleronia marisminoris]SFH29916.1 Multimeric flavodoxin WrbA [Palleronia marisminoris]